MYGNTGFPSGAGGKEPACQSRRHRNAGLIPGLGRSPGGGHGNRSGILAWRISWTEEPSRLYSPQSCKELDMTEATWHAHGPQRPSLTHHFVN